MTQQFHSWVYIFKKTKNEKARTLIRKDAHTPVMFIAPLFAKIWMVATCVHQQTNGQRGGDKYTPTPWSTTKLWKWAASPFAATWLPFMLSEISQTTTNTAWYHLCVESKKFNKLVRIIRKNPIHRYREQSSGYQQERTNMGVENDEVQAFKYKISHSDILYKGSIKYKWVIMYESL